MTTALLLAAVASGEAQQWPTRPIRVISPFPAGSASDTTSRIVLDQISQLLGRPMVIESRPGAGGRLGFAEVAKAEPDGYTLVTSSSSMASGLVLHKSLPYDPVRDFVPVALFGIQPNVLVASTQSGFKTVADLVAAAKAKPATLTFASAGIGSTSHMAAERFRLAADIDVRHIPFREGGLTEVMAGRIDFYFLPLAAAASALATGKACRPCREHAQARRTVAECADTGRSGLSQCGVLLLGRIVGAGEHPARHRQSSARGCARGSANLRGEGQPGQGRRRAAAHERRAVRQVF